MTPNDIYHIPSFEYRDTYLYMYMYMFCTCTNSKIIFKIEVKHGVCIHTSSDISTYLTANNQPPHPSINLHIIIYIF